MLQKACKKEQRNHLKPLVLHEAGCIVCGTTIHQTTASIEEDAICYKCYQSMWGKKHNEVNHSLKKAVSN